MEIAISIITGLMILGALYAIHAKDLLSAVIACGIVGYGLVICFLLLKAPDLAIVQIVVETITLIIMVAVVLDSSREEPYSKPDTQGYISIATSILLLVVLFYFFKISIEISRCLRCWLSADGSSVYRRSNRENRKCQSCNRCCF